MRIGWSWLITQDPIDYSSKRFPSDLRLTIPLTLICFCYELCFRVSSQQSIQTNTIYFDLFFFSHMKSYLTENSWFISFLLNFRNVFLTLLFGANIA